MYTVGHKKRATLFLIITLPFLGQFYTLIPLKTGMARFLWSMVYIAYLLCGQ